VVTRAGTARLTIVYDNNAYDERLEAAWGFSCLVEWGDLTLLFDTGGDGQVLLSNMEKLSLDPTEIDVIVLSHVHGDHVGGLGAILDDNKAATVYLPRSFPARLKRRVSAHAEVVQVYEPVQIAEGIYTTGQMRRVVTEQSLVLVTEQGLVVITGCAHPGIARIIEKAREIAVLGGAADGDVQLVLGGFHLSRKPQTTIEGVVEDLQRLGVQKVAACHCSGDLARSHFATAYGEDFIEVGVGSRLEVGG